MCATHYALALRNLNATGEHVMMPSASPKQRVLIVGAKFGEMYLNAFMQPPEGLELVGLLAQGSARSRELAHAFGIPLYTSPEQITRMP
ncbi:Gfo/Idh/MocA family oxidoreductase, partial [Acinetobacter baumannii]